MGSKFVLILDTSKSVSFKELTVYAQKIFAQEAKRRGQMC